MSLLKVRNLQKAYGKRDVVNGIDIDVNKGEIVGLLGKNGAGKTTAFRMIVGMIKPKAGEIFFGDKNISKMPMYRRSRLGIGYLSQSKSVFQGLTVESNIMSILETLDMPQEKRVERLEELLTDLSLHKVRHNTAGRLSGGECRRLEIARALVTSPNLILLDEPFSGVDPIAVYEIQDIIATLRDRNIGVLLTDHNVRETFAITDRTYIMEEGQIWIHGRPEDLAENEEAKTLYLGRDFYMDFDSHKRRRRTHRDGTLVMSKGDENEAGKSDRNRASASDRSPKISIAQRLKEIRDKTKQRTQARKTARLEKQDDSEQND